MNLDDLNDTLNPAHQSTRGLLVRLLKESVRPYVVWIAAALVCMGLMAAATAFSAWLMEPVVNDIFIAKDEAMLWFLAPLVVATFVIKGAANYGQSVLMSRVGLRIVADNQARLYAHLTGLDLAFFHRMQTGRLLSRFLVDINSLRNAVSNVLTSFGKDLMTLIGLVVVMFAQDWLLALISFVIFPIAIYPIARIGRRMRRVTANTQEENGLLTTLLEQTIQGIRVVKSYGMQDYEQRRVGGIVERIYGLTVKAAATRALSSPIMETLGGLAVAVVIVYGGLQVIEQSLDAGSFFSFLMALLLAYEPMKRLANLNTSLQEGLAGAQRLFALLDVRASITDREDAIELDGIEGEVSFVGVDFAYEQGQPALLGVDLNVPAGKTIALVGPSGAGKSTILNLIPRFYDVDAGRITIDGHDVRDVTSASLHAHLALVSQEIALFDDTVRANIGYGRAGADQAAIEDAARHAAAHDFITALPNGYDTQVGEQGVKLSGGQRQRLAIARAMLKNAPILLLDEATSALDTESERQVQAALDELMKGRTTLVIAHRLSTVVRADVIYVIDRGRVIEQGSHAELLARGGLYNRLYEMQFAADDAMTAAPRAAEA